MKLVSTGKDALGVDPRPRDATRTASDSTANDNNSPPFDGVMAEVRGDNSKNSQAAVAKTAAADGGTSATASSTTAQSGDAVSTNAAGGNAAIMNQLISFLANGAAPSDAQAAVTTKGSDTGDDEKSGVGSLLKRMAKDDTASADAQQPATSTGPATDLLSILMLGAGASGPQVAQAAGSVKGVSKDVAASGDAGTGASDGATASATATPETIVSDIVVSTHLAPAGGPQNKTPAVNETKTTGGLATDVTPQASAAAIAPVAGGAHERGDGDSGSFHGDANPSATAMGATSSLLSSSFAPVRSIATAIGELAAKTAAPAASASVPAEATKTAGVARTLTLQMTPPDLGTVGIRLHVTGQTLDVQLSFSNAETMGMVSRDRDTLSSALQDQNYQLNSLVIQDGGASASSGGNNAATQGDTSGSNPRPDRQQSASDSGTSNGGRQSQDTDRQTQGDRRPSAQPSSPAAAESRGGSLFV